MYWIIFASNRYKEDIHDRTWDPSNYINSSLVSNFETWTDYFGPFDLPNRVMRTAIAPDNTSNPLKFTWEPRNATDQFLIYLHFSEVQTLQRNQFREFDIYLNGNLWSNRSIRPYNRTFTSVWSDQPEKPASKYEILIQKTKRSTLPPILNAMELYKVKHFLQSQTDDQDGKVQLCCAVLFLKLDLLVSLLIIFVICLSF